MQDKTIIKPALTFSQKLVSLPEEERTGKYEIVLGYNYNPGPMPEKLRAIMAENSRQLAQLPI